MPLKLVVLMVPVLVLLVSCAVGKQSQTYYTPERIAIGRGNVEKYAWAQATLSSIMKGQTQTYVIGRKYVSAEDYSAQSDEFLWELQPPTSIPRIFPHEAVAECPICGTAVRKLNAWHPWRIDPINHPYQIRCMMCNTWFPSNKYGEGDMTSGEYPDDGNGYVGPDGRHFFFIREYAVSCYTAVTIPCLNALSQAWVLTGDTQYAHKCAVLLARLASEYPNHDDRKDRLWDAPYGGYHPHYKWKKGGMITDLIWETFCTEDAIYAYDAIYDYLDKDPELIEFLKAKGMPIENGQQLREYIEHYLLRAAGVALLNGSIHGNMGHHQATATALALVLDDHSGTHPNSKDMVEYTYYGGGQAAQILVNGLYRDGGGHESPGYSTIKLDFIRTSRMMEQIRALHPDIYPVERYPDLFGNEKAPALFDFNIDLIMMGALTPSIGDERGIGEAKRHRAYRYSNIGSHNIFAFTRYGDPRYARASTRMDGSLYPGELFEPYPEAQIRAALESPEAIIAPRSRLLDGYGAAILEAGEGDNRHAVCLNYAAIPGHRQQDNLNLEVLARGVDMLPDLGYPFSWDYTEDWDSNIMAHNTVSVGETKAHWRVRAGNEATLFASRDGVHAVTAHHVPYPKGMGLAKEAAPDVDLYERTVVMVDVDETRFYVVDLFAVNGGDQHDQSWHGPLTEPTAPDLDWVAQPTGTLAGPEVEQFATYTDRWGREDTNFPCYLKDIRKAALDAPAVWEWSYGLEEGDGLRLHILPLGGPMQAIMGSGRNPARPVDWQLDYLFCRRMVENGARSLFLTVIDPFQGQPAVQSARVVSEEPLEVEVAYEGGVDRIHIGVAPGPSATTQHRAQGLRVVSTRDGQVTRDVQVGHWASDQGPGYVIDTIAELDYGAREIAIPYAEGREQQFAPGCAVRVHNDRRTTMHVIVAARRDGDRLWLKLNTTALLARGPVTQCEDGAVMVGEYMLFGTAHPGEDGKLARSDSHYFAGAWLGEGTAARTIEGVWRDTANSSKVFLIEPVTRGALESDYAGKTVSIWEYGLGDTVELAVVEGR